MIKRERFICLLLGIITIFSFTTGAFAELNDVKWSVVQWKEPVNMYNGEMDLSEIGIKEDDIIGFDILKGDKRTKLYYGVEDTKILFASDMMVNTDYSLRVITKRKNYDIKFKSSDLPSILATGDRIIVRVPAMPEKGFNWPYYLAIPSNDFKNENQSYKRYLMVDTTNSGQNDLTGTERWVKDTLKERQQYSVSVAEQLWVPMLMPVFPRTNAMYNNDEFNMIYEHAFDRDIATLHINMKNPKVGEQLRSSYKEKGFNVDDFLRLDKQLVAMFDHAVEYLNKYEHNVDKKKMFLSGYSASGTFTDRFAALQPDKVKAVASGGTLDDMILPLEKYKGKSLIFPIGTYDYKAITGREFDISKHNNVAKLIYMGKNDTNNTVPYDDCYGKTERNIIIDLWGQPVLPRAEALTKLYGESGGKGIFILDKGIGHGTSRDMNEYVLEFFRANRNSSSPVYPIPKNENQLQHTIYK